MERTIPNLFEKLYQILECQPCSLLYRGYIAPHAPMVDEFKSVLCLHQLKYTKRTQPVSIGLHSKRLTSLSSFRLPIAQLKASVYFTLKYIRQNFGAKNCTKTPHTKKFINKCVGICMCDLSVFVCRIAVSAYRLKHMEDDIHNLYIKQLKTQLLEDTNEAIQRLISTYPQEFDLGALIPPPKNSADNENADRFLELYQKTVEEYRENDIEFDIHWVSDAKVLT